MGHGGLGPRTCGLTGTSRCHRAVGLRPVQARQAASSVPPHSGGSLGQGQRHQGGRSLTVLSSPGYREGLLWKRGRDNGQFLSRKFVLTEREGALKYFNKNDVSLAWSEGRPSHVGSWPPQGLQGWVLALQECGCPPSVPSSSQRTPRMVALPGEMSYVYAPTH